MKDLSIHFLGKRFPTPFLLSSSPVSNTAEIVARGFEAGYGGVAYKTLGGPRTRIVNPAPRMQDYRYAGRNLFGLQNVEQTTDRPFEDNIADIRWLKKRFPEHVVIGSIMGFSKDEWRELAMACEDAGVDMLELNFSCPHMTVEGAGMKVGQAFGLLREFTEIVRSVVKVPILAKLTSNVTDITEPALYAKAGGADAITAINTVRGLIGVDLDDYVPVPNVFGKGAISGFSGPAIKPIGLKCIVELARHNKLGLPLAGCGGIETWIDAVEYLLCGASLLQMTTGVIHYGHRVVEDLCEGLSDFMADKGYEHVSDIVGKALPQIHETGAFDLSRQGAASYDLDRCVGCGQCYVVCKDAGGHSLSWDEARRRPIQDDDKCFSCMICSFVCPVDDPPMIRFREMPGKEPAIAPSRL